VKSSVTALFGFAFLNHAGRTMISLDFVARESLGKSVSFATVERLCFIAVHPVWLCKAALASL
jgi:hypothetical protein